MIRTVALLALIASASAIWPFDSPANLWKPGFFETFPTFDKLALNIAEAKKKGFVKIEGPATPKGYEDLTLMMKPSEPTIGLYYDGKNVAGVLIALPVDQIELHYNATEQGLKLWTCSINGVTKTFYVSSFFFVSEDKSTRIYDENQVVQAKNVNFVSTNGNMDTMPRNLTDITRDDSSVWKKQGCMIWMGLHYYHSMTKSTTCDKPFVPYFGLYDANTDQLIGIGFMVMGDCKALNTYEHPDGTAVKLIVKNGPQCLYEMVPKIGVCTHHFYFVDNPRLITC